MSKPAWDESRKFYASRLPHDWWTRVIAKSAWGSGLATVTSPGAFPFPAIQVAGESVFRVGIQVYQVTASNPVMSDGPFQVLSATTVSGNGAWQLTGNQAPLTRTLLTDGRRVQRPWFVGATGISQNFQIYVGELLCDVDPFDFDALYED